MFIPKTLGSRAILLLTRTLWKQVSYSVNNPKNLYFQFVMASCLNNNKKYFRKKKISQIASSSGL